MSIWRVQGGYPLEGSVTIQGAKNAVLPVLAACILTDGEIELTNVPVLRDVEASLEILRRLGCTAERQGDVVSLDCRQVTGSAIPGELAGRMRSSVIFLGALLARCGQARLALPGGCALGPRPVDLHLAAMEALGAHTQIADGELLCWADGLAGGVIPLEKPSVGATENAMIAACGAKGASVITGAAQEPEIVHLQGFLRALGADMDGAGTSVITVRGFKPVRRGPLWSPSGASSRQALLHTGSCRTGSPRPPCCAPAPVPAATWKCGGWSRPMWRPSQGPWRTWAPGWRAARGGCVSAVPAVCGAVRR